MTVWRVGGGMIPGALALLRSRPWLVARVVAYARIALVAARIAASEQAWIVWLVWVLVTYEVESWMNRGASRPAEAGSLSPEWVIFLSKSMASG